MKIIIKVSIVSFILLCIVLIFSLIFNETQKQPVRDYKPLIILNKINSIKYNICCLKENLYIGQDFVNFDSLYNNEIIKLDSYEDNIKYYKIIDTVFIDDCVLDIVYFFVFSFNKLTGMNINYVCDSKSYTKMINFVNSNFLGPCYNIQFHNKRYSFNDRIFNYIIETPKQIDSSRVIIFSISSPKIDSIVNYASFLQASGKN